MAATALANVRMPKAVPEDDKYIDVAKETLANPRYKSVNPHKRLIIKSKVRRKEKKEGTASGNTITVYHYVWDQYQVATAEKDREGPGYQHLVHDAEILLQGRLHDADGPLDHLRPFRERADTGGEHRQVGGRPQPSTSKIRQAVVPWA